MLHPDPGTELTEVSKDRLHLRKVVEFLERVEEDKRRDERFYRIASRLDKFCFSLYLLMCFAYFSVLVYMFCSYPCDIEHFGFWYDEEE